VNQKFALSEVLALKEEPVNLGDLTAANFEPIYLVRRLAQNRLSFLFGSEHHYCVGIG
jgi:hypothetical protein